MAYDKNSTCEIVSSRILAMRRSSFVDRSNLYLAGTLVPILLAVNAISLDGKEF